MSKLSSLKLQNFTAFSDFSETFSPGVNILIGANGTGKTHLLKLLYSSCAITSGEDREKTFAVKIRGAFAPYEGRMGRLARRTGRSTKVSIIVRRESGASLVSSFSNHTNHAEDAKTRRTVNWREDQIETAYIPVKEMLAHAPGFLALAAKREVAFEDVYTDLIKRAYLPRLKGPPAANRKRLIDELQKAIEGKVVTKGEYFFLKNAQGDLEFSLLAEGMRKLALIWLLIQNGTLLSGSILFWDEPEANLNPALMGQVVEIILELQRMNVQIFLSTHNYVLLKEFDLRKKKKDAIRYISLYRNERKLVQSSSTDVYSEIHPNTIADTFSKLYDEELTRDLGEITA